MNTPFAASLEQLRALDAIARHGSFLGAARALRKGHTAVLYAVRTLEAQTGLTLLDRSGYRARLSPHGQAVLSRARLVLEAEGALGATIEQLRSGWEASLKVVLDGIVPTAPVLEALGELVAAKAPTRFDVTTDFLSGVAAKFIAEGAHLMVSVLPVELEGLVTRALEPIEAVLVAARRHPLVKGGLRASAAELERHVLLTVHGSDPRLQLPTRGLEQRSTVRLSDFSAKKAALLSGFGYGWMPRHLVDAELSSGVLRRLNWSGPTKHVLKPVLAYRPSVAEGRAGARLLQALT